MKNSEMGGMPPAPKEEKPRYVVGAKKNPDGSMDYSKAASWDGPKSGAEKEKTPEFQQDVQAIIKHLDKLNELLDEENFRLGWSQLDTHLNHNITGITAFERVLSQVSPAEYDAIVHKAGQVENKLRQALDLCKAEKVKEEIWHKNHGNGPKAEYVSDSTFMWLEKEGPAVMQSLKELRGKVQE